MNRPLADIQFKKAGFIGADISFFKELQFVDFFFAWGDIVPERESIAAMLFAGDSFSFCENGLALKMDYAHGGQERFSRLYKLLDPERKWTSHLSRTAVSFKNEG